MIMDEIKEERAEQSSKPEISINLDRIISESQEAIATAIRKYDSLLDESTLLGMIQGSAFERIALDYIESTKLGFISLDPERTKLILNNIRAKSIRNPDGITTKESGIISGVIEVKLDPVRDTNYRAMDQFKHFGENIYNAVQELKEAGRLENVNIVKPDEMQIAIVHPSNAREDYGEMTTEELSAEVVLCKREGVDNMVYLFIPITKERIIQIAKEIKGKVVDGLDEDVKYWIVQDDWVN